MNLEVDSKELKNESVVCSEPASYASSCGFLLDSSRLDSVLGSESSEMEIRGGMTVSMFGSSSVGVGRTGLRKLVEQAVTKLASAESSLRAGSLAMVGLGCVIVIFLPRSSLTGGSPSVDAAH